MSHVIPLTGFLGAGKTTTVRALAHYGESKRHRVAVVTNDQDGDLIDTLVVARSGRAVAEVTGGCFCCRYDDLRAALDHVAAQSAPRYILAESVGSCTDLTATVVRPLERDGGLGVGPLIAVVDPIRLLSIEAMSPSTRYLFERQLLDADLLAVNKCDLLSPASIATVAERLADVPARTIFYSARTGAGLAELWNLATESRVARTTDLEIDYDEYAAAEAELAWLNRRFTLHSAKVISARDWNDAFLRSVAEHCTASDFEIGHVKVVVRRGELLAKASLTHRDGAPQHDRTDLRHATAAVGIVNARVACEPDEVEALVERSMEAANRALDTQTQLLPGGGAFAPAAPQPTHRVLVAG
ncbi:MAG: hypothetical protein HKN44_11375 [Ilumatobacter sp.]|nr:hypothetical protein [Ilumatobacter sp.]